MADLPEFQFRDRSSWSSGSFDFPRLLGIIPVRGLPLLKQEQLGAAERSAHSRIFASPRRLLIRALIHFGALIRFTSSRGFDYASVFRLNTQACAFLSGFRYSLVLLGNTLFYGSKEVILFVPLKQANDSLGLSKTKSDFSLVT